MDRRSFLVAAAALAAVPAAPGLGAARAASGAGAHAFGFAALEAASGRIDLAEFAGRPVLLVNTASRCGFTHQYEGLQTLWETYRDRGLVVIGAPSRDFGRQEFADADKIRDFCEVNFGIDFPMTELVSVKGRDAHPFYTWAREAAPDLPAPRWNFHKYLIGPDGRLAGAWGSSTPPDAPDLRAAIEALLPQG